MTDPKRPSPSNRPRVNDMTAERQEEVRKLNAKCAKQYRERKKEDGKEAEMMYKKNEAKINQLEKMVDKLSSEIDSGSTRTSSSSTRKKAAKSGRKEFFGDAF